MKKSTRSFQSLVLAIAASLGFNASSATLNVGDPAPKLQTGKFVQGDAVTDFNPGTPYIVEFWATWCGPCRMSIPHLNQIYTEYKEKGLIVIGQNCWEQDESKVAPFVSSMGDKMTYRVSLDNKEGNEKGKMAETWMAAAGQNGIPTAFLIDKTGHVAWIGHPMSLEEKTIEAVLNGTFDIKKAAAQWLDDQKNSEKIQSLESKLNKDMTAKEWDAASADVDEFVKLRPELAQNFKQLRFKILNGKKEYAAANTLMSQLAESTKNEPAEQNELAWLIVSDKTVEHPDLALAQTMAQRAVDGAADDEAKSQALDTLARVKFLQGNKDEAIETEKKAVELAVGDRKTPLSNVLAAYKKGELPPVE